MPERHLAREYFSENNYRNGERMDVMPGIGGETTPAPRGHRRLGHRIVTYGKENRVVSTLLVARFELGEDVTASA